MDLERERVLQEFNKIVSQGPYGDYKTHLIEKQKLKEEMNETNDVTVIGELLERMKKIDDYLIRKKTEDGNLPPDCFVKNVPVLCRIMNSYRKDYFKGRLVISGLTFPGEQPILETMKKLCKQVTCFGFGRYRDKTEERLLDMKYMYPEVPVHRMYIEETDESMKELQTAFNNSVGDGPSLTVLSFKRQLMWTRDPLLSIMDAVHNPGSILIILGNWSYHRRSMEERYGERFEAFCSQIQYGKYFVIHY